MRILFFGDIVGKIGRQALVKVLPNLRDNLKPDLVMANVENLAHGKGVTYDTLQEICAAGVQVCTSGNHVFRKSGYAELFANHDFNLLRPANYPPGTPGAGYLTLDLKDVKVAVINLMGRVFFPDALDDPFRQLDEILEELGNRFPDLKIIIVDWHAEASSEKAALGWQADGRVSAVLGTHTHTPTADARILPDGTGYVSDVGLVGARDSILGVAVEGPLEKFKTQLPQKFEIPETGFVQINGVYLDIDESTGKTLQIKRVDTEVEIK